MTEDMPKKSFDPGWAERAIERFARDSLRERQTARRWSIFFRSITLLLATVVVLLAMAIYSTWSVSTSTPSTSGPHTALIRLDGLIFSDSQASADRLIPAIEAAYKDKNTKGVVLRINSPGGTAVQSNLLAKAILRLKAKYPDKPFIAVADEMCTSGGYYIAAVADKVYVNESTLIGSIGIVFDNFGFLGAMDKLGVERRIMTAGDRKAFLDPFSPLSDRDRQHAKVLLDDMHRQFIDVVKAGRGNRLKLETPELFSGLVWTGRQSVAIGLADGVGDVMTVAEKEINVPEVVDFTPKETVAERLARQFGAVGDAVSQQTAVRSSGGALMLYQP